MLVVAEQLRRALPGGIGRYAEGLLSGLAGRAPDPGGGLGLGAPDPDPGGGQASRAPDPGDHLALLASRWGSSRPRPAGDGGRGDPLERWGFPVIASRLPGPILTRAWDHRVLAAPGGFDVVHAVSLAAPAIRGGRDDRSGRPAKLVVTVHDLAWRKNPEATTARGRRWHEAALRRALRDADAFLVPSDPVADDLRAAGADPGALTVVHWGADHLPRPDRPGAGALLAGLGVRGPYLLTASTREPRKNLHRLVAAYVRVRSSLPDRWSLVVVGPSGWSDAGLGVEPGPDAPVPDGVVATGPVSDPILSGLYAGARVFAYVPLSEGYGLPPLEAMTFGVPVVASTGVPSVAPEPGAEEAALRVDPLSVDAIAAALAAAATDEPLRARLAGAGAALVGSRTWRTVAGSHLQVWKGLR